MSAQSIDSSPTTVSYVSSKTEVNGILKFTIKGVNVSFANALRRTILSDIPTAAFRVFPHSKNEANIVTNTSRLNNEILKQRLGCIPIHLADHSLPFGELLVEINARNTTDSLMLVTTESFKVKNTKTDKYLDTAVVRKIFPPDPLTGDYILFARLRPRISNEVPGEELSVTAKISLQTARDDGMYNVCSICSYGMTPDKSKQVTAWTERLKTLDPDLDEGTVAIMQQDWYNLESERIFIEDSFDFAIRTIGVFPNGVLVQKACNILINRLDDIAELAREQKLSVERSISTLPNSFDITLVNEDYSVGKVIEFALHQNEYRKKTLSYVGFRKNHPHDTDSIIRAALKSESENPKSIIYSMVQKACSYTAGVLNEVAIEFQDNSSN